MKMSLPFSFRSESIFQIFLYSVIFFSSYLLRIFYCLGTYASIQTIQYINENSLMLNKFLSKTIPLSAFKLYEI